MGENICKCCDWQGINQQPIETAHSAQYHKNKQPNQNMDRRSKQTFLQRRHTDGQKAILKRCSILLINREMQIKTTVRYLAPSSKCLQTVDAGEGVEKREHLYTAGGNVN